MSRTKEGFDKTHLSIDRALRDGNIHRDYIAHCHRWSYIVKRLAHTKGKRRILDFGCGKEIPLYNSFCSNDGYAKLDHYYGVDLNKVVIPSNRIGTRLPRTIYDNTNILDVTNKMVEDVNTVTSLEVFEHCPPEAVPIILKHLHTLNSNDGEFIYSTPVFNGKAAKNHVNEMSRDCFGWLLEETGHTIVENYGTFASQKDYYKHLTDTQVELLEQLRPYYHTGILATIFAPLYPEYSRNNIWVCKKRVDGDKRKFPTPGSSPRAQHDYWEEIQYDLFMKQGALE